MATATLLGGAIVGATFGEAFAVLHDTVKNVGSKALAINSELKTFKSKLDLLAPEVEKIRQLNQKLNRPDPIEEVLIKDMSDAEQLICNFPENQWFINYSLGEKLTKLNDSIVSFCTIHMQVQNRSDILQILQKLEPILQILWKLEPTLPMSPIKKICGLSCEVPRLKDKDFTVGLDEPLKVLKTQLLKETKQQLLLTAPGGCGKTTLVKMLGHDQEIKGKFKDNIFFVPVSKNFNLMGIVQTLFSYISHQEPEFQSDEDAIHQLQVLLTQIKSDPILLCLDDVQPGSEILLEKFKFDMPNYNILVTSRTIFPSFSFACSLKLLNDEDARALLCHSASLQDDGSHIPVEFIEKIVRGCGGFPLALYLNGVSLIGKPVEAWSRRAEEWSNGHSIFNSTPHLLLCLGKSLEFPDEKNILKECFMDLGSFPKDQRIAVPALIDMWAELHGLDEDGNDAINNLHELTTQNLATLVRTRKESKGASENSNYYNCYNEGFVTQHDLLRELAVYESSQGPESQRKRLIMNINKNTLPKWCAKQDQHLIKAHLLSITTDELFSLSWCNIKAPDVEVLILNFQTRNYNLPDFVDKMDKLKVLIINNYGSIPAEVRNFQLLESLTNLKAIRLERIAIPSLCEAPVLLRSLEKISLFMCDIGQAFGNSSIRVSDSLTNLKAIYIESCNDLVKLPAEFSDLIHLELLSIANCHNLSAVPKELWKLKKLRFINCHPAPSNGFCKPKGVSIGHLFPPGAIRNRIQKRKVVDLTNLHLSSTACTSQWD